MSSSTIQEIIDRIEQLPEDERSLLEARLAELDETAWRREAKKAREEARARGIDQGMIDRAVEAVRYSK